MTDAGLRNMHRAAAATGDSLAQAQLLRERVRAGTLTRERVRLAAWLSHETCRAITVQPGAFAGLCGLGVSWQNVDLLSTRVWSRGLLRLAADVTDLPEREELCKPASEGACSFWPPCPICQGTGTVRCPWPGDQWVALGAAIGAGRAAHRSECCCQKVFQTGTGCGEWRALNAAETYWRSGTLAAREACRSVYLGFPAMGSPFAATAGMAAGLVDHNASVCLGLFADQIGPERVREAAREILIPEVLRDA